MGSHATEAGVEDEDLAESLRRLRAGLGLSQEQLARELGVSYVTVNRWESGRARMSAGASKRLAAFKSSIGGRGLERFEQQLTSFVGRASDLARLESNLRSHRLVTLVGPGGVGKTRLARELAVRFGRRLVMVSIENAFSGHDAVAEVSAALGLRDRPGEDPVASLAVALESEPTLLVLDGAEQLRGETALLATTLLRGVEELRVLVTSRQLLGVPGETVQALGPLSCPPEELDGLEVSDFEAVELFLERARQRLPELATNSLSPSQLAALCRGLDGLPLAIELLAGWIGTLSLGEILGRSRELLGVGGDGSGLRNVIERSWLLLDDEQRQFLKALSVLRGSFLLSDAAALSSIEETAAAVLLRSLVESSWLLVEQSGGESRLRFLETMRGFLSDKLTVEERVEAQARHMAHYEQLAVASEAGMLSPEAQSWAGRLSGAWPDIEAALESFRESGQLDRALRTAAALWPWWLSQGRLSLGRRHLDLVLEKAGRRDDEAVARANCAAAVLAVEHGAYSEAIGRATKASRAFKSYGCAPEEAMAATVLGSAYRYLDDLALAREGFEAALEIRRQLDDKRGVAVALNNLALLALDSGSYEEAAQLFSESLALKRQLGNTLSTAIGLSNLSTVLIRLGRGEEAAKALSEAAELAGDGGNLQLQGSIEANLGELAASRDNWGAALGHFEASAEAERQGGHAHDVIVALLGVGRCLARLGQTEQALAALREAEQLAAATGNRAGLNKTRVLLAEIAPSPGQPLPNGLTPREGQVLERLALGENNKAIAQHLSLSCSTVEHHLTSIYRKISVSGRVAAARWAAAHGLVASGS